jgi:hypothetical protein
MTPAARTGRPSLTAPFAYPTDPAYVTAATTLRAARDTWFTACAAPSHDYQAWRLSVDAARWSYDEALRAVRDEEDRILGPRQPRVWRIAS